MAWIPGATFRMGSDKHYPEEAPVHRVTVDGFWIDRMPVTNREFRKFVNVTGYVTFAEIKPDPKDYPGALPHMLKAGSLAFTPPKHATDTRDKLQQLWKDQALPDPKPFPVTRLRDIFNCGVFPRLRWKFRQAANPIFISQDSLGYGSLSRFQILIFTSVVGLVLFYIFVHSSVISPMSETILLLLGITVAGGTSGRVLSDWPAISPRSRRLLLGEEILDIHRHKPRASDLLETHGEVDVAKVQALLFTCLVAISIFVNGVTGLANFELPREIIFLLGISQTAFIVGGVLKPDTVKHIEQDFDQLRIAAENSQKSPSDPQATNSFEQAKRAAAATLSDTYGKRFNSAKFNALTPDKL